MRYRFSTEENLDRFKASPDRYEPAYGGWCAYAMSMDKRVDPSPKSFLIQDGRLHLFYKSMFSNNRKSWLKKPETRKVSADKNWKAYIEKKK